MREQTTLRSIAYDTQGEETQNLNLAKDGYENILTKTREYLSHHHANELAAAITDEKASEMVKRLIAEYVDREGLHVAGFEMHTLTERLYLDMAGFGFLEQYIHDPAIEEINCNAWNDIEVVKPSGVFKVPEKFSSPQQATDTIRKMVRAGGYILDNTTPIVDSFIARGTRMTAYIPPCVDTAVGAVFSLRRQTVSAISHEELVEAGTATADMLELLSAFVNYGISTCFAGKTNSGKTTNINYLLRSISNSQRVYVIEETPEIDAQKTDNSGNVVNRVISTLTRQSDNKANSIDMSDLLRKGLRMSPDVIVPAEMRGSEALAAQEAARTGHTVLTTVHANSARAAYDRIMTMCYMAEGSKNLNSSFLYRLIIDAFPVMAFTKKLHDGTRRIMEIIEAKEIDAITGLINATTLYKFDIFTNTFVREAGISKVLAAIMLENGADFELVKKHCDDIKDEKTSKTRKEASRK